VNIVVFNQTGVTPAQLVEKYARETAEFLAQNGRARSAETTRSQLRRFYQEWLTLRKRTRASGYEKSEVGIKMLIAKAAYALGRQNAPVPKEFVDWLQKNLKEIKSKEDVEAFGDYFEAMVGYFYGEQAQKNRGGDR